MWPRSLTRVLLHSSTSNADVQLVTTHLIFHVIGVGYASPMHCIEQVDISESDPLLMRMTRMILGNSNSSARDPEITRQLPLPLASPQS